MIYQQTRRLVIRLLLKGYEMILMTAGFLRKKSPQDYLQQCVNESQTNWTSDSRATQQPQKLAIVIPFKDRWTMTEALLHFITKTPGLPETLIVLVNNNSIESETRQGLEKWQHHPQIRLEEANYTFNFSKIINQGIQTVCQDLQNHDLLMILNNDIEFERHEDLTLLVRSYSTSGAGILGCSLFYPDRTVQHLYAQPGAKIVATHPFKHARFGFDEEWFQSIHTVPAVTGAVMLFSKACYQAVGQWDEKLPTVGQDIDFCLAAKGKGFPTMVHGQVRALHMEGATRGKSLNYSEVAYMYKKWGDTLTKHPLLLKNCSRWSERILPSLGEGAYPWWLLV